MRSTCRKKIPIPWMPRCSGTVTARMSSPSRTAWMICSWPGLNDGNPNTVSRHDRALAMRPVMRSHGPRRFRVQQHSSRDRVSAPSPLGRPPFLETLADSPAEPDRDLRRVAGRGERSCRYLYLTNLATQPKHDVGPISVGSSLLFESPFQPRLQCRGIFSLMFGRARVHQHRNDAAQFPTNRVNRLHGVFPAVGR